MRAFYYIDSGERNEATPFRSLRPKHLRTKVELERAAEHSGREDVWIVFANRVTELLSELQFTPRRTPEFIVLGDISRARVEILRNYIRRWVHQQAIRLPLDQLATLMAAKNRKDLLVGGEIDQDGGLALFYRGDFSPVLVPLTAFPTSGDGITPDFGRFSIEDHGQTVRFGEYEASTESILYEFDAEYRKRYRKNLIKSEKGLGASIRRLRLQKGLRQSDFPGIDEKEIRRIEAGEVKKPHQGTMQKIAAKLGVDVKELGTF